MARWHTCDTTHCIAGWACVIAKNGKTFEKQYGTQLAGLKLLGIEAHSKFFVNKNEAREYLRGVLEAVGQTV